MRVFAFAIVALLTLTGCQNTYLSAMESAGIPKRQILVNRIEDARDAQIKARFQFSRALDRYRNALHFGDDPQQAYATLERDYAASEKAAAAIKPRIDTVEQIADALFDEWEDELDGYASNTLRDASARELKQTRAQYSDLIGKMRTAQGRVEPALGALRDQMLFYNHSLNAKAINSVAGSYSSVQGNVQPLLLDMQRSIDGAEGFMKQLSNPTTK